MQFGFICRYVSSKTIASTFGILGIAGLWTIMEWIRLFVLSGFSFNPIGISLTGNLYSLQMASLWGIYGLSFWIITVNLIALKAIKEKNSIKLWTLWIIFAAFPYLYGAVHYHIHSSFAREHQEDDFKAILVQTAFPVEETLGIQSQTDFIAYVFEEWNRILEIIKKNQMEKSDLVVLPEFVVPLGTYTFVYPYDSVRNVFKNTFGESSLSSLPPLSLPWAKEFNIGNESRFFVNNAFWSQAIANIFKSPILLGLEDVDEDDNRQRNYYSSAIYIKPWTTSVSEIERYEKRILVPMGEYIPFEFCRKMAAEYGINGSFTCGTSAKVLRTGKFPFGVSICYEETFGDLIRESRVNGAEILVNLTSDIWYPDSKLTKQHFDHARLRTVESGIPLIRSCNTGITCAFDSLGNLIDSLPEYDENNNWLADSLYVKVPSYHYNTLYSKTGDGLIISLSFIASLHLLIMTRKSF